jgi:alkylation response protein AidB-like acyl-CoA dehydrogenase
LDLTLSPAERKFRDDLRAWLEANHPGEEPSSDAERFAFRRRWQRKVYEAGWAGISWPKAYGGRGATLVEQAIWGEEIARARAPRLANLIGLSMAGPTIIAHGTEAQKARYLPGILSSEDIWCQGFSEPESGSDLASLKTRAVRHGDRWLVNGQKVWTSLAHFARYCILIARTGPAAPKHKGLTYFILDMEQPGVEVRPLVQITGESEFNELFLVDACIPHENMLGAEGDGWKVTITTLMHERATLMFAVQAQLRIELGQLFERARTTHRNGGVAAHDPIVRDKLAQLYTEIEIMRLNAYRNLASELKHGTPGPEGSVGKWMWADVSQRLTELALDIAGPRAQLADGEWTYRYLRARARSIEGGTTEIVKNIVAERVLGLPRLKGSG